MTSVALGDAAESQRIHLALLDMAVQSGHELTAKPGMIRGETPDGSGAWTATHGSSPADDTPTWAIPAVSVTGPGPWSAATLRILADIIDPEPVDATPTG